MWTLILICLCAYALGSVPFGLLLSRILRQKDPREYGSGNIGATNVFRSVDPLLGVLTLVGDGAKGWLPAWVAVQLSYSPFGVCLVAAGAFLGHLFPFCLGFRGGKGVATGAGVFLALAPHALAGSLVFFLLGTLISGYVSVGSMLAALSLPCFVGGFMGVHPYLAVAVGFSAAVLWRHRENIARLRTGTERRWRS
jgi:glycerol-3-phosphate acyltransferase PlsY